MEEIPIHKHIMPIKPIMISTDNEADLKKASVSSATSGPPGNIMRTNATTMPRTTIIPQIILSIHRSPNSQIHLNTFLCKR